MLNKTNKIHPVSFLMKDRSLLLDILAGIYIGKEFTLLGNAVLNYARTFLLLTLYYWLYMNLSNECGNAKVI